MFHHTSVGLFPSKTFLGFIQKSNGIGSSFFCFVEYASTLSAMTRLFYVLSMPRAHRYDVRVEHLWTYCQVISAMLMSIAHGSNDIANAVGPVSAVYQTWQEGVVATVSGTPVWLLAVGGIMLGLGFWILGYNIVRALGNKITQMSPTRGFAIELGAATTVLMASRLGLPVSTTQCLTGECQSSIDPISKKTLIFCSLGSAVGVALMNFDLGAVNWRQVAFIFMGWVLTLPCAGLISGLLCLMALNAPSF